MKGKALICAALIVAAVIVRSSEWAMGLGVAAGMFFGDLIEYAISLFKK